LYKEVCGKRNRPDMAAVLRTFTLTAADLKKKKWKEKV
jgi:hypothetical protein